MLRDAFFWKNFGANLKSQIPHSARGMGHHDGPILTQFYNLMSPKVQTVIYSFLPSLQSCLSLVSKMTFQFRDDVVDQCFEY